MTIKIAHDFVCPWCWIALLQARRLQAEFGVSIEWLPYLLGDENREPTGDVPKQSPWPGRPTVPSRLDLIKLLDGVTIEDVARPLRMGTKRAHLAIEYAKRHGDADKLVECLYRAYWQAGLEIESPALLERLALPHVDDVRRMLDSIESAEFEDRIVSFDEPAYASGVFYVPTFFVGESRLAEQPYVVIRSAVERELAGVLT